MLAFKEVLADCRSILDIGCGTGTIASALRDSVYQVTSADASLGMLRLAKKRVKPDATYCVLSDTNSGLHSPVKGFDICLASYIAHGLKPPQKHLFQAEMRRLAGIWRDGHASPSPIAYIDNNSMLFRTCRNANGLIPCFAGTRAHPYRGS